MGEKELREFLRKKLIALEAARLKYEHTNHPADEEKLRRTGEVWAAVGTVLAMAGHSEIVGSVWEEVEGEHGGGCDEARIAS